MLVIWSLCLPFAHLHYVCIHSQETLALQGALNNMHDFRATQTLALGILPWNSFSVLIKALSMNYSNHLRRFSSKEVATGSNFG